MPKDGVTSVSILNDVCQKRGLKPLYQIKQIHPYPYPFFQCSISIAEISISAMGRSRKKAKLETGRLFLDELWWYIFESAETHTLNCRTPHFHPSGSPHTSEIIRKPLI